MRGYLEPHAQVASLKFSCNQSKEFQGRPKTCALLLQKLHLHKWNVNQGITKLVKVYLLKSTSRMLFLSACSLITWIPQSRIFSPLGTCKNLWNFWKSFHKTIVKSLNMKVTFTLSCLILPIRNSWSGPAPATQYHEQENWPGVHQTRWTLALLLVKIAHSNRSQMFEVGKIHLVWDYKADICRMTMNFNRFQ